MEIAIDDMTAFSQSPSSLFRVVFKDGDVFLLTHLRDCSESAEQPMTWTGVIVDSEKLSDKRKRLHRNGGILQFCLSDISSVARVQSH